MHFVLIKTHFYLHFPLEKRSHVLCFINVHHVILDAYCHCDNSPHVSSATSSGSRGGARGAWGALPPLFWLKEEEIIEGKKASRASKTKPPPPRPTPPLSSRSGSPTGYLRPVC